ncbi:hypothetical protein QWI17_19840 [Gilvimarinus sp. SDUM040013]|uniref:Uncharacterized protein n=1 Tax=Gilvimarinus gilvus TaxID=3058038 RepID=A0ABU4RZI7_9GAMM|nr:hypothetical protein [Gilvimarinus sp. SDUM040013]MDO3388108.1 hypothetical protein [Gilvimarinus sp. SDUM040013]MDX6850317.1 hypothetical protein [Gilvimarinus sp. SDUM040013]
MKLAYPLAGVTILLVCMWLMPSHQVDSKAKQSNSVYLGEALRAAPADPLHMRIRQMQARRPGVRYRVHEVQAALAEPSLWTLVVPSAHTPSKWPVHLNRLKLESLLVGDQIHIQMPPEGTDHVAIIERVTQTLDGLTWFARFADDTAGGQASIKLTLRAGQVGAAIDSKEGKFALEVSKQGAWLIAGHD